jgi:hypothetical protein
MEAVSLGPQDLEAVFNVLKSSLSQDSTTRNQGETTLRSLELSPGFSSCLTEIIDRQEADHSVRWLAAVHLKNSINKYWRSRSTPGSLSEDEKSHLRDRILRLMEEEDSQIAIQLAVVVSKMARFDYPKSWPQLFTELVSRLPPPTSAESIQSNTVVATPRRTALVLHHVLKELSSKRLASDQKCFEQLTTQIIQHIWTMWLADTTAITAILPSSSSSLSTNMQPSVLLVLERWLLELKVLSRLFLFGYSSDSKTLQPVAVVAQAVNPFLQALAAMSQCLAAQQQQRATNDNRMQFRIMAERGIIKLLKILRKLVDIHPWSVFQSGALIPALEFCCSELLQLDTSNNNNDTGSTTGKTSSLISEDHTKEALMFIITTLNSKAYKGSSVALALGAAARTQLDTLKLAASQVKPLLEQFWSANNNRERLCYTLIMQYLPLKRSELEDWEDSPESFYHEKDYHSTTWEDSVRGCAEHTYLALFESSSDAVAPVIIELIKQAEAACPVGSSISSTHHHHHYIEVESMRNIPIEAIQKAAVYHAAAVGAYELHDHIDFSPWLHSSLLPEISSNNNNKACKPIKQAALRVVSYWVSKLTASDRSTVYAAVLYAMQDPDPVISLSAVSTLHALVEDWEFTEEGFAPYISPVFSALASMLSTLTELDSQSQVFAVLNALMSRLNDSVKPHAPGLLALLPGVWKAAEGQSLLRIQVLVALQRLVVLLGPESTMTHSLVVPLLRQYLSSSNNNSNNYRSSTDATDDEALNLREDVLHLWLMALRCAAYPVPGLLAEPFPYLVNMLQSSTEYVSFGMRITFSAILLGNGPFLETCGQGLVQMLTTLITTVNERGVATILPVVDVVLQSFPDQGPHLLAPVLVSLLKDISKYNNSAVAGHIFGIYSRVLLQNTGAFLSIFSLVAADQQQQQLSSSEELLLLQYIDHWIDKIDCISQAAGRKLSALALCVLITLPIGPGLLHRLGAILGVISGIWFELESEGVDELTMDFYNIAPRDHELAALVESEDAEMEGKRRKALGRVDPVRHVGVGVFVREQFNKARGVHGEGFDVILNGMDSALSGQIRTMLGM